MFYPAAKVYFDGHHYVAIPYVAPHRKRKIHAKAPKDLLEIIVNKEVEEMDKKEKLAARDAYANASKEYKGNEREKVAIEELKGQCISEDKAKELIEKAKANRERQIIERKKRFWRKALLNEFNYFVTFTYDDKKHNEQSFKKGLIERLSRLKKDKGWKYMGIWEISPNERLHFHGLLYVPDGNMIGELELRRDYSTKQHIMQETIVNTYFEKAFGRNDFRSLIKHPQAYEMVIGYIMKYITKTNDKVIYSRNLPMYLISDINAERDELCRFGLDDRKIVLPDDFECWDEGEFLGNFNNDIKNKMRTLSH